MGVAFEILKVPSRHPFYGIPSLSSVYFSPSFVLLQCRWYQCLWSCGSRHHTCRHWAGNCHIQWQEACPAAWYICEGLHIVLGTLHTLKQMGKIAPAWQNQQNDLCVQRRLWSDHQSFVSDWRRFGSLATYEAHSKDSDLSHAQCDLSLHWVHMSFCWFCYALAQISMLLQV